MKCIMNEATHSIADQKQIGEDLEKFRFRSKVLDKLQMIQQELLLIRKFREVDVKTFHDLMQKHDSSLAAVYLQLQEIQTELQKLRIREGLKVSEYFGEFLSSEEKAEKAPGPNTIIAHEDLPSLEEPCDMNDYEFAERTQA